jgi:iron complex outermembrane receptor protein
LLLAINSTDQPQSEDPGGIDAAQATLDRRSPRAFNVQFDSGEELNQQRIGGVYKTDRLGGELMLRNYYVWRDFTNRLPFVSGGAVDLQRFFYGVGAQYGYEGFSSSGLRLIAGFDLDRQDDDRIRFDNNNGTIGAKVFDQKEKVDSSGIFLLGQYKLSDTWSMSAGLRYDRVEFSVDDNYLADGDDSGQLDFDRWSPSLAVNYKTERGVLFASWSRSFETPTTTELANPDGTGGFSQSLEPQIADNFEVGFKSSLDSITTSCPSFISNCRTNSYRSKLRPRRDARFIPTPGRQRATASRRQPRGEGITASRLMRRTPGRISSSTSLSKAVTISAVNAYRACQSTSPTWV